ncbi:MAG: SH3 domain-containing protein [Chloroflexi bacterium]|nr:SH3 domain-containing protein [Chloroflexota bacterium]
MRGILLLTLLAMLSCLPLSQARDEGFPPCSSAQLRHTLESTIPHFQDVYLAIDSSQTINALLENLDGLPTLRSDILPSLLSCEENVQSSLLMSQILGDSVGLTALRSLGLSASLNPYPEYINDQVARLNELQAENFRIVNEDADERLLQLPIDRRAPKCSSAQLTSLQDIAAAFRDLHASHADLEIGADLLAYIEQLLEWRLATLPLLPSCVEAQEFALRIIQMTADTPAMYALRTAGVDKAANPFYESVNSDAEHLTAWINQFAATAAGDEMASGELLESGEVTSKTYYITASSYVNIRSCGSTNCDIVGTADRGQAITVIDDSGGWYEIRLENGETAFIAGFLTSLDRPKP